MTDKIIIDGVDVSKCKYLIRDSQNESNTLCGDIFKSCKCEETKDCYYKQLQASQQIIRDLEKRVMQLEDCLGDAVSEKCSHLLFKKIKHIESEA